MRGCSVGIWGPVSQREWQQSGNVSYAPGTTQSALLVPVWSILPAAPRCVMVSNVVNFNLLILNIFILCFILLLWGYWDRGTALSQSCIAVLVFRLQGHLGRHPRTIPPLGDASCPLGFTTHPLLCQIIVQQLIICLTLGSKKSFCFTSTMIWHHLCRCNTRNELPKKKFIRVQWVKVMAVNGELKIPLQFLMIAQLSCILRKRLHFLFLL